MRGYAVHLVFHLLAGLLGAIAGVAAGMWWTGRSPAALWLAIGALIIGFVVLLLQNLYINALPSRARRARPAARSPGTASRESRANRTLPEGEFPSATPNTWVQPADREGPGEAAEADVPRERRSAHPPTKRL